VEGFGEDSYKIESKGSKSSPEVPKCKVLVAEDNTVNQKVVKNILTKQGCAVKIVGNGQAAFEAAKQEKFDVILMDWQMPVLDGIEATKKIRDFEKSFGLSAVPIIALTADGTDSAKQVCLDSGMSDYILKPFSSHQLKRVISNHLMARKLS